MSFYTLSFPRLVFGWINAIFPSQHSLFSVLAQARCGKWRPRQSIHLRPRANSHRRRGRPTYACRRSSRRFWGGALTCHILQSLRRTPSHHSLQCPPLSFYVLFIPIVSRMVISVQHRYSHQTPSSEYASQEQSFSVSVDFVQRKAMKGAATALCSSTSERREERKTDRNSERTIADLFVSLL